MPFFSLFRRFLNAYNTRKTAKTLFPTEAWNKVEPHIWVAQSRLIEKTKEPAKWDREMSQAHILTSRGSIAYFLPDMEIKGESGKRCADLVLDGCIMELKTVTGTVKTLGWEFKKGFKQGKSLLEDHPEIQKHSVFIQVFATLTVEAVKAKIAGELKDMPGKGDFLCFFEHSGTLHSWPYAELRSLIRRETSASSPG
jgi:hypothetical protein